MRKIRLLIFYLISVFIPIIISAREVQKIKINVHFETDSVALNKNAKKIIDSYISKKTINNRQFLFVFSNSVIAEDGDKGIYPARQKAVKSYLISKGIIENHILLFAKNSQKYIAQNNIYDKSQSYPYDDLIIETESIKYALRNTEILKKCTLAQLAKIPEYPPNSNTKNNDNYIYTLDENSSIFKLPNGDEFTGILNNKNNKTGTGIYVWIDGQKYEGGFKDNKRNGKGVYTLKTGAVFDGIWQNDLPVSGKLSEDLKDKYLLKILANVNCSVYINNTLKGSLKSGIVSKFFLQIGAFQLKIINNKDTNDVFETYYLVKKYGKEDLLKINLGSSPEKEKPYELVQLQEEKRDELSIKQIVKNDNSDIPTNDNTKENTLIAKTEEPFLDTIIKKSKYFKEITNDTLSKNAVVNANDTLMITNIATLVKDTLLAPQLLEAKQTTDSILLQRNENILLPITKLKTDSVQENVHETIVINLPDTNAIVLQQTVAKPINENTIDVFSEPKIKYLEAQTSETFIKPILKVVIDTPQEIKPISDSISKTLQDINTIDSIKLSGTFIKPILKISIDTPLHDVKPINDSFGKVLQDLSAKDLNTKPLTYTLPITESKQESKLLEETTDLHKEQSKTLQISDLLNEITIFNNPIPLVEEIVDTVTSSLAIAEKLAKNKHKDFVEVENKNSTSQTSVLVPKAIKDTLKPTKKALIKQPMISKKVNDKKDKVVSKTDTVYVQKKITDTVVKSISIISKNLKTKLKTTKNLQKPKLDTLVKPVLTVNKIQPLSSNPEHIETAKVDLPNTKPMAKTFIKKLKNNDKGLSEKPKGRYFTFTEVKLTSKVYHEEDSAKEENVNQQKSK